MKISFIGPGRVGVSLGKHFQKYGLQVAGYFGRNQDTVVEAAEFTKSRPFQSYAQLLQYSDIVFLTVPDRIIAEIWDSLKTLPLNGKIICHCSGALTTEVFQGADGLDVDVFSIHPLASMHNRWDCYENLKDACFSVEGNRDRLKPIYALFQMLPNKLQYLEASEKAKYHAACVMASNFVNAITAMSERLLVSCGLPEEFAHEGWRNLFLWNVHNMLSDGITQSLTGPVERNDSVTIQRHLDVLRGDDREIYRLLSSELVKIASIKNPDRDYTPLEKLLSLSTGRAEQA
ncbi:DUF2520 domain-containing protein [Christensenellaceae bacterium OttesenSCG-928-M15]|nr:DUF2520 domain-containing protein [Christensenellaceae bacterium OttesenSCG-928-M15]